MTTFAWDVAANAAATGVLWAAKVAGSSLLRRGKRDPRDKIWIFGLMAVAWLVTNAVAWTSERVSMPIFVGVTTLVMMSLIFRDLWLFYSVGLAAVDRTVSKGLDYSQALRLCTNSLDFLGTGAAKLTKHREEFEAAIERSHREGQPVRFLLMDPDHGSAALSKAAQQARVPQDEYRHRVVESLRTIADITVRRSFNVEVRLYRDPAEFRLMFINDEICLVSYNAYGKGEGSQLPQLHILKPRKHPDTDSFYFPFKEYFRDLWDRSEPWDFQTARWDRG